MEKIAQDGKLLKHYTNGDPVCDPPLGSCGEHLQKYNEMVSH